MFEADFLLTHSIITINSERVIRNPYTPPQLTPECSVFSLKENTIENTTRLKMPSVVLAYPLPRAAYPPLMLDTSIV